MEMKDKLAVSTWLKSGASLADVETVANVGIVGNVRFTPQAVRAYKLLWTWCAFRFAGSAGRKQDNFFNKCGSTMFHNRLARANRIAAKLAGCPK